MSDGGDDALRNVGVCACWTCDVRGDRAEHQHGCHVQQQSRYHAGVRPTLALTLIDKSANPSPNPDRQECGGHRHLQPVQQHKT